MRDRTRSPSTHRSFVVGRIDEFTAAKGTPSSLSVKVKSSPKKI
jgi:hypothetical protein